MATKTKTRGPAPYRGPYGTPLAHVQYREGRHLEPERIPFRKFETPTSIRLLDMSKESLENLKRVAASIKRLLAPSLKLQTVPESLVAYLEQLERLDLGHNRLTDASFPDSMKTLDCLVELRLNDNQLTRVPNCLKRMRNLSRLDLSNNQLDTASGLEKLKKMQFLVLDNNHLTSIFKEISALRRLEMLRCSSNNLRDVPRDIRNLRQLRDLDISNNRIVLLTTDVFQLPRLECLNASQNQVAKVPSFNVKVQNKHWITSVDLSDNNLVKFPGHLMHMTHKLDLSSNKIKTISWATLKKLDHERDHELLLSKNPLTYPPSDVCESGLNTIKQFFQESQADVKTYQGVKVLVVGAHRSGKTSLIHSLVDQQARLSDEVTDTAAGIDAYEMSFDYDVEEGKPGKSLNLCLWDLCGDPFYLYPHYLFHEQPSICILTFSMPDYTPANFAQQVGSWFDWMIAKTNKLVVILVATKTDLVSAKRAGEITREVREKLAAHLQRRQTMIESRIKEIEQRPVISPTLSEQLKAYMKLLQARFTVQTEVITTSSKTFKGFDKLKEAIERQANDRKLFPNVMRVIPTFWVEVENWLEEKGNSMVVPVMQWEEFSEEVTQRFGMKHLLTAITQYLHESGKVLWFSYVPSLKNVVFLRPSWLFDVMKQVFRHDLDAVTFNPDETLKAIAFTPTKFERLKLELLTEGVVDRELLKALLVSLIPADRSKPSMEVLQIFAEGMEMGYPVAKRSKEKNYTFGVDRDAEGKLKIPKLMIPWFRRSAEPISFRETWAALHDRRHLAVLFKFPCYMPPGLFEILTVRAYNEKHKLVFLNHWGGGVHAKHTEEKVQLLIMYYREGGEETEVDVEVDDEEDDEEEEERECSIGEDKGGGGGALGGKGQESVGNGIKDKHRISSPQSVNQTHAESTKESRLTNGASSSHHSDSVFEGETSSQPRSKRVIPIILRTDSTDSLDSVKSDDSDYSSTSSSIAKRRSRRSVEQEPDRPATIEEIADEDNDDIDLETISLTSEKDRNPTDLKKRRSSKESVMKNAVDSAESAKKKAMKFDKEEQTREGVKSPRTKKTVRRKRPTDNSSTGDGNIVLKLEVRDNSEDKQDQTPASSMWNVLLPLLMDFEELLQGYAGVLVERRTECPICGEASFLGEWLTPKDTQGQNTRACEACNQQVDTAFLVQPREKKRVVINRNRLRHRRPSDLPVENGEVAQGNTTSCVSSSDAASNDVAPP